MKTFKELFESNNEIAMLSELNAVAISYYNEIINSGLISNMEECKYFLLCLDKLYQNGKISPLRDEEYDLLLDIYLDNGGEMIRGDMSSGDKAKHVYPDLKGTIKKVHFITEKDRMENSKVKNHKSLETWFKSVMEARTKLPGDSVTLGFYTKFDGISVILEVEDGMVKSAITRGDKELGTGQDKTKAFRFLNLTNECKALNTNKFGLKCEALMSKEEFPKYNKKFGDGKLIDERSAATAIMNSDEPSLEEIKAITLMPLMLNIDGKEIEFPREDLYEKGFCTWARKDFIYTSITFHLNDSITKSLEKIKMIIDKMESVIRSEDYPYPCDGIVVRVLDEDIRKYLGRNEEDCINNWERAYKFKPFSARTKLITIEQNIGLLGKVSFTAKVEPVKLKNKIIKSISLGSAARFKDLNLAVGDEVVVHYDIIPYLTVDNSCKKSGNEPIPMITECPCCHTPLEYNPELSCTNRRCDTRKIGKIYNFCVKMGMEGIGEETITTLYYNDIVKSVSDLYKIKDRAEEIKAIDGFGKKAVSNLIKSIENASNNVISADVFLGALGVPRCNRKVFQKILSVYSFTELMDMEGLDRKKAIMKVPGFGGKMARIVDEGLTENKYLIEDVMKYVKNISKTYSKPKMKVVFSGIRNHKFERFLNKQGIEILDNINKNCDLLIIKDGTKTSKVEYAEKKGIPVMGISEAYRTFGYVEDM